MRDTFGLTNDGNADTIAQGLSAFAPEKVALEAGRVMLKRPRDSARELRFRKHWETIQEVFQRAVEQAVIKHKRAGNPIAVSQNGELIWIAPEQIPSKPCV